ncbi:LOW QUALITY PROTEIN: hypothetical protein Cgig2_003152 [Carnegiea gigantea]|uniref:Protein kinase domain-containing protein n=1 Tax=Carnegiea gigantea TaxID=171969 RepID=A0A9Q1JMQ9_9CARY|nr:LOW QUALITY PROTEIN: hypothetical protein Cgig2_003152 [Carnegiea gigantea]
MGPNISCREKRDLITKVLCFWNSSFALFLKWERKGKESHQEEAKREKEKEMTIEKEDKGFEQTRKILVAIRFDDESKELLGWALFHVAQPQDHVVALHVCRSTEDSEKHKLLLDDCLENYRNLCDIKKVKLSGQILTGKSIRKSLVKEANDSSAAALIVGVSKLGSIGSWLSTAKYCAKHLPPTTDILSINNGKIVFKRTSLDHPPGLRRDQQPSMNQSEFGDSEKPESGSESPKMISEGSEAGSTDSSGELLENKCTVVRNANEGPLRSVSLSKESSTEQRPGWPLLRRASVPTQRALESRKMSVVQWAMSLPDRSPPDTPQSSTTDSSSSKSESPLSRKSSQSVWSELMLDEPAFPFELSSSNFIWFSYEVLNHATSHFSSEKLIGKGGSSRVYKGVFLDGSCEGSKVIKTSMEGFFTRTGNRGKSALSWESRFRIAIGIAEAVNFLHNECSRPVIHRDIKSSNILLSDNFEPQLSDFGLAIWGPNSSSCETCTDIVGTFGYLAPEYVMYGKVSNKLDVYSFGVVLLELLSGRKPIDSSKGQESLAKPILESGKLQELVDPNLADNYDESQMQRMLLAATLCLARTPQLRPNMDQVLRLLKGEETVETWAKRLENKQDDGQKLDVHDDEVYQDSGAKRSHLSLALLDIEDDIKCHASIQPTHRRCLADLLKGR